MVEQNLSIFSPQALAIRRNRALLLQFILAKLLESHQCHLKGKDQESILSTHPKHFPYDWAKSCGCLNQIREHGILLKQTFPDHKKAVKNFEHLLEEIFSTWSNKKKIQPKIFEKTLCDLFFSLEELLFACRENENLIHFLLKNRLAIDALAGPGYLRIFLLKIHPSGLEVLGEKMCDKYHQRGFISQIPELKLLMADLIHA